MSIDTPDTVPVSDADMQVLRRIETEVAQDSPARRITLEIPAAWIDMKAFVARAMAARDGHAEGGDYDVQALADLRATFEDALHDELQALLMGLHDCQQPKSEPATQAAAPDPRDDDIPF